MDHCKKCVVIRQYINMEFFIPYYLYWHLPKKLGISQALVITL